MVALASCVKKWVISTSISRGQGRSAVDISQYVPAIVPIKLEGMDRSKKLLHTAHLIYAKTSQKDDVDTAWKKMPVIP